VDSSQLRNGSGVWYTSAPEEAKAKLDMLRGEKFKGLFGINASSDGGLSDADQIIVACNPKN
jgi:hypothetical protein